MNKEIEKELQTFPVYEYCNRSIRRIMPPPSWNNYLVELHHFIRRQEYNRNPEKYKDIQKLIFLPIDLHRDVHAYNRNLKERWGIELDEVLYREWEWVTKVMIINTWGKLHLNAGGLN